MSYSYLLDLYRILDDRIKIITDDVLPDNTAASKKSCQQGRADCLNDFKTYLKEHYHHKLPRRIQKSYESVLSEK